MRTRHATLAAATLAAAVALPTRAQTLAVTDGLEFWVHAGEGVVVSGANVTAWNDLSGNAGHLTTNAGSPQYVTSVGAINNMPVINFTADRLEGGRAHGYNTRIMVVNWDTNMSGVPHSMKDSTVNQYFGHANDGNVYLKDPQTSGSSTGVGVGAGNYAILVGSHPAGTIWMNGAVLYTGSQGNHAGNAALTKDVLGYRTNTGGSGDFPFYGNLAEVAVFGPAVNDAQRIILENYLSAKYDIPLNTGGGAKDEYAGESTALGHYDHDVNGVGRETTAGARLNPGAQTVSAGAGLVITTSTLTLDDAEYLLAGHKAPVNYITDSGLPRQSRWERVWYFDKTLADDDLAVDLTFDFTAAGLTSVNLSNYTGYRLLYSSTDPYAFAEVAVGALLGDQVLFTGLDFGTTGFQDGYYTLGLLQVVPEPSTMVLLGLGGLLMTIRHHLRKYRCDRS